MQRQDKMWALGLAVSFAVTCLLMAAALGVYLSSTTQAGSGEDDLREWMRDASEGIRGKVAPLPEIRPYEPASFVPAGQSPFARDVPVGSGKTIK
jgi:Tfp pilus assembly protein PilP